MNEFDSIKNVPFFSHLLTAEIEYLVKQGNVVHSGAGRAFYPEKDSFYTVLSGYSVIKKGFSDETVVTFSTGSFFGTLPFMENTGKIILLSLTECFYFQLSVSSIYKLLSFCYKASRGYIRAVQAIQKILIKNESVEIFKNSAVIVAMTGVGKGSGKSLASCLFSSSVESNGKSLILDLSTNGKTSAAMFGFSAGLPLSQKMQENSDFFSSMPFVRISENIDYLNVTNGSLVKTNPDILRSLVTAFSKNYKYVILDLDETDDPIYRAGLALSDYVFFFLKEPQDLRKIQSKIDDFTSDGQKVFYVPNLFFLPKKKITDEDLFFDKIDTSTGTSYQFIKINTDRGCLKKIAAVVTEKKQALVLNGCMDSPDAIKLFFKELYAYRNKLHYIAATGPAFIIGAFFTESSSDEQFIKDTESLFKDERINLLMDIKYPDSSVIKMGKFRNFLKGYVKNRRIENGKIGLLTELHSTEGTKRLFSTGRFSDLMTASFSMYPLMDGINFGAENYSSGYPSSYISPSLLRRFDIEKVSAILINDRTNIIKPDFMGIYKAFLRKFELIYTDLTGRDSNIIIDMHMEGNSLNEISKSTANQIHSILKG